MDPILFYRTLLKRASLTTNGLARRLVDLGMTEKTIQSKLNKWENGISTTPAITTLQPVADYFKVDVGAFYKPAQALREARRIGLLAEPELVVDRDTHQLPPVTPHETIEIREYETGGSMGAGLMLRDQPGVIRSWHVSPEWIEKNVRGHTGRSNLCIVTGFGDSMRPLFNPGDPLIIDTGVKTVEFDAVYFFRVDNEGFIKRLQRIPGEGLVAISDNKSYRDWTIRKDMDFEVFGKVLKVWRSEDF
ncbi:MAG TPA: S24 family peptidase [Burkholderiaceae bacterium]|nr:S24 family peptidase [Burkholderiaceae bacterium]